WRSPSTGRFQTNAFMPESIFTNSVITIPPNATNLVLRPFLVDPFVPIVYGEGTPFPYPVADSVGEVTLANASPPNGQSLPAGITTNFSADVTYSFSSRSEADLALRVYDQIGSLLATSTDPAN